MRICAMPAGIQRQCRREAEAIVREGKVQMKAAGLDNYEEYLNQYYFQDDRTVSVFEYTKRAIRRMDQILSSLEFETCDAQLIYRYLVRETTPIPFSAYLKRYIYIRTELEDAFESIPDSVYAEIIRNAFFENHMAFSFQPTRKKSSGIIRGWLTRESVQRKTVFLLGFGLRMDDRDVTDFLTKCLKEADFDFYDPTETVYWYCLHHHLSFDAANRLLEESAGDGEQPKADKDYLSSISMNPKLCLWEEDTLREYLRYLKVNRPEGEETAFCEFKRLYGRVAALCAKSGSGLSYEIENVFSCGIPRDPAGNLKRISESSLRKPFLYHKMSRQRMSMLLGRERPVNRFDLITFLFYLYSRKEGASDRRRDEFIREANSILTKCHMAGLYFANPYEAFVTMCLMTDEPLGTFGDVWEMSYEKNSGEM